MKHSPLVVAGAVTLAGALFVSTAGATIWTKQNLPPPAPPPAAPAALSDKVKLELVTRDTTEAVAIIGVPGEPVGRLFVVEKQGPIRILRGTKFDPKPFYDMTGKVSLWDKPNSEQGLLGMAFHPKYLKNGKFYINFTDPKGDTRVVELQVDKKDPNRADPSSARELLFVHQPYANHNGGDLKFGPDGKLYVGLGDGGKANDPHGNGQNPKTLLAKLLRIDVDAAKPTPEVLAKGLRNPWRYTFDRKTGDLYIADVGQNVFEMVHMIPHDRIDGPTNLGWNITEGKSCFQAETCNRKGLQGPLIDYSHSEGCSIAGGYVYRGKALPQLNGMYFYSDFCTAILRSFRVTDAKAGKIADHWDWKPALDPESTLAKVSSFGEDQDGELYVVTHEGPILKLVKK
jgi:glucose/arabinose dehydrogenase